MDTEYPFCRQRARSTSANDLNVLGPCLDTITSSHGNRVRIVQQGVPCIVPALAAFLALGSDGIQVPAPSKVFTRGIDVEDRSALSELADDQPLMLRCVAHKMAAGQ